MCACHTMVSRNQHRVRCGKMSSVFGCSEYRSHGMHRVCLQTTGRMIE